MKKLVLLLVICISTVPAFAQWTAGRLARAAYNAEKGAVISTEGISQQVSRAVRLSRPLPTQYVRISNLPKSPILPLRPLDEPVAGQPTVLPARMLEPIELRRAIFPSTNVYIPASFGRSDKMLYRGLILTNVRDLKRLLKKGMEMKKSHYRGEIFSTSLFTVALDYAMPHMSWSPHAAKGETVMPVVVKIPLTKQLILENRPDVFGHQYIFSQDVLPTQISDVMLFLEVNGKASWYRVELEDGTPTLFEINCKVTSLREMW